MAPNYSTIHLARAASQKARAMLLQECPGLWEHADLLDKLLNSYIQLALNGPGTGPCRDNKAAPRPKGPFNDFLSAFSALLLAVPELKGQSPLLLTLLDYTCLANTGQGGI